MAFRTVAAALLLALAGLSSASAAEGDTVKAVRSRGSLNCGTSTGTSVGLSTLDDRGEWRGFEVDFCRAVAAALLGDATKVVFSPLEFRNVFAALQGGKVDLVGSGATWTYTRDSELQLDFPGVYLFDGQGFMVAKKLGIKSAEELGGASICVTGGSTTELNLADWFRSRKLAYTPIVSTNREQNQSNLEAGRCDAYTNERGGLAASRLALKNPDDFVVLPDVISKEPTSPVIRQDDARFRDVVAWTLNLLITAEELGLTQANVKDASTSDNRPEVQRLLGRTGEYGAKLGLSNDWAVTVITAVGNYGEVFERNLGSGSKVKLERGLNRLWSKGGLLYSPPFR